MRWTFVSQFASTLLMTGIIWFVQVVHYPLFLRVGRAEFIQYEAEHANRTGWVVGPLMCVELTTAILLLFPAMRPAFVPAKAAWLGAVLLAAIWLSTGLIQVPLHNRLSAGYDFVVIQRLIATNWLRTLAWSLRSLLVLSWFAKSLHES